MTPFKILASRRTVLASPPSIFAANSPRETRPPSPLLQKMYTPPSATTPPPARHRSVLLSPPSATRTRATHPPPTPSATTLPPSATRTRATHPPPTPSATTLPPSATRTRATHPPPTPSATTLPPSATRTRATHPPPTPSATTLPPAATRTRATHPPPTPSATTPPTPSAITLPPPCYFLAQEQKPDFYVYGNKSVPSMVRQGPFKGVFNHLSADIIVYEAENDLFKNRLNSFVAGPLRGKYLAEFYGVQRYFDPDTEKFYRIYGFANSVKLLQDLNFYSNSFGLIQSVLFQCVKCIDYVHSEKHFVDNLSSEGSFMFEQVGSTVTVKLYPYNCVPCPSPSVSGGRSKESDVRDFAEMLTKIFFGASATLADVLSYNPYTNKPPIRFVPQFVSKNRRAYSVDVVHFLIRAARGCHIGWLLNDPLIWDPSKRLDFFRDGAESIGGWYNNDPRFIKLNNLPCFINECGGKLWLYFPNSVRIDLNAPTYESDPKDADRKFCRGSGSDFLRCLRNLLSHDLGKVDGRKHYLEYVDDGDVRKGLDLYLSAKFPGFLTEVYEILLEMRDSGDVDHSLDRYLLPSYDEALYGATVE